jgi:hypothetical protein
MSQIKIQWDLPQGENPQREERLRKICFVFFMQTDFLLWVFYTERKINKNNMKNFRNQIHEDLYQEVLPLREKRLREKKHKMSQMKIL